MARDMMSIFNDLSTNILPGPNVFTVLEIPSADDLVSINAIIGLPAYELSCSRVEGVHLSNECNSRDYADNIPIILRKYPVNVLIG
jgi:hypothetical protein